MRCTGPSGFRVRRRVYIENLGRDFDPDTFLRMNLNAIGEQFGCDYAVSFEVVRL